MPGAWMLADRKGNDLQPKSPGSDKCIHACTSSSAHSFWLLMFTELGPTILAAGRGTKMEQDRDELQPLR